MAEDISYEAARDQLIEVVRKLESGGTSLEESIALWKQGEDLAAVCDMLLTGAKAELEATLANQPEQGETCG